MHRDYYKLHYKSRNYNSDHISKYAFAESCLSQKQKRAEDGRDLWRAPVQPPAQSRGSHSRLSRIMSSQVLKVFRDGDSTASKGNLFLCLTTLTVSIFLILNNLKFF